MNYEQILLKLKTKDNVLIDAEFSLNEDDYDENVFLELKYENNVITAIKPNFFDALIEIRKNLEKKDILIMCNGAGVNVYPSGMQFCMGVTRKAYMLNIGEKGKLSNIVDIFDYDDKIIVGTIDEQMKFYNNWLNS